jgi:hypothetical protein
MIAESLTHLLDVDRALPAKRLFVVLYLYLPLGVVEAGLR